MSAIATTKMSSKGQVVIPEEIREQLELTSGAKFVVVAEKDTVILKLISPPPQEEFSKLLVRARSQAKKAGLKKDDVRQAIKKVRKSK